MKDFFKKYPGLIIFIGIGILLTLLFIFYEIMYNGQNRKQQAAYEELNKNAWITEFEPYHVDTGDDDADFRAENEAKEKAFLVPTRFLNIRPTLGPREFANTIAKPK